LRTLSAREDDAAFVKASQDFGRVVQTVVLSQQTGSWESWPEDLDKPLFELKNFDSIISQYQKLNQNVEQGQIRGQFPIRDIRNSAGIIGNVSAVAFAHGVNIPAVTKSGNYKEFISFRIKITFKLVEFQ